MDKAGEYYNKAWNYNKEKNYQQAYIHFTIAAEMGHADAQNFLGTYYLNGYGVEEDEAAAVEWFQKAAGQNNMFGNYNLGRCYQYGWGVEKDPQTSLRFYLLAAEQGHAGAQNEAGRCYLNGWGHEKDHVKAAEWFRKAAAQNNIHACYNLGLCYQNGWGVEKDSQKTFQYYLRSAELGYADAQNEAGYFYLNGWGVEKDYTKALEWFRKAADQDNMDAIYHLGRCYEYGWGVEKDMQKAVQFYQRSADLGRADAQNDLGVCYLNGQGVKKNEARALEWFRKAVAQDPDNKFANYNLGRCYQYGWATEKNPQKAFPHFLRAAEQGHAASQNKAGFFYLNGMGTARDDAKALEWFRKAVAQNEKYACYNMGFCYEKGRGVSADKKKALEYYEKAVALGHENVKKDVDRLRGELGSPPPEPPQPPQTDGGQQEDGMSAYDRLQALTGLDSVKRAVGKMIHLHQINAKREEALGKKASTVSMHMVFTGNPGTGKTTVARIIGELYHEMGLLSKGQVKEVKRADLVAENIGGTEANTKRAIEEALGGILFIDEAYTLSPEDPGRDFGPKAVDTILTAMEENRGNLVVIVAGYEKEMQRFINSNPGLKSRFKNFIRFEDYNAQQLHQIFRYTVESEGYRLDEAADSILAPYFEQLYRTRGLNFGNGREVRNFFESVLAWNAERLASMDTDHLTGEELMSLTESDIQTAVDEQMGRTGEADGGPSALEELDAMTGLASVKEEVRLLQQVAVYQQHCREMKLTTTPPTMHMVFTGNPGTGKTTVARIIGRIYHELGLLPESRVTEVKRADLVAGYVGQTDQKARSVIQRALGGVLFIDEAYTLSPENPGHDYGQEAINVLLTAMEENRENLAVIVAGYDRDMRRFINSNPGLKSRFTKYIHFDDYDGGELAQIFHNFAGSRFVFGEGVEEELRRVCNELYQQRDANFGNARDVRNLFDLVTASQADRVTRMNRLSREDMMQMTREDILNAEQKYKKGQAFLPKPKSPKPIGFN